MLDRLGLKYDEYHGPWMTRRLLVFGFGGGILVTIWHERWTYLGVRCEQFERRFEKEILF